MANRVRVSAVFVAMMFAQSAWAADSVPMESDADVVLAKNSLATVTKADFYAELRRLPDEYRGGVTASGPRIQQLVDNLLITKTMAAQARLLKIDTRPEVKAAFAWIVEKGLAQMRSEELTAEIMADFKAKEADFEGRAKEVYKTNKQKYMTKPTVTASHVLINTEKRSKEEALKRAQEVYKLAKEGKGFDSLAEQYSDDPSAKENKGSLGTFGAGQMVKPFEDAVFALEKAGDISQPVETQFGYHVILLQAKNPSQPQSYEEVRASILDGLKGDYVKLKTAENLGKINGDKERSYNEAGIATLKKTPDLKSSQKQSAEPVKQ